MWLRQTAGGEGPKTNEPSVPLHVVCMCLSVNICVCVYVFEHEHVCESVHECECVCVCVSVTSCVCLCLSMSKYIWESVCMSVTRYVCVCLCGQVCVCMDQEKNCHGAIRGVYLLGWAGAALCRGRILGCEDNGEQIWRSKGVSRLKC